MKDSKIGWTHHTFNPWRGCTKVSPGCVHCYAERGSKRNPRVLGVWGDKGTRVMAAQAQWDEARRWDAEASLATTFRETPPPRVFCASLADVFEDWPGQMSDHKGRPLFRTVVLAGTINYSHGARDLDGTLREPYTLDDARGRLWALIRLTPHLDWLLLTKRPENIARMMPAGPWHNVWLGTTVEDQEHAVRLDILQDAAAGLGVPVRFCAAEPLLGRLDLDGCLGPDGINWVIVGGESGGGARTFRDDWARLIIHRCEDAVVPCFVKQMGSNPLVYDDRHSTLVRIGGKGDDPDEWPESLRVQQFPIVKR